MFKIAVLQKKESKNVQVVSETIPTGLIAEALIREQQAEKEWQKWGAKRNEYQLALYGLDQKLKHGSPEAEEEIDIIAQINNLNDNINHCNRMEAAANGKYMKAMHETLKLKGRAVELEDKIKSLQNFINNRNNILEGVKREANRLTKIAENDVKEVVDMQNSAKYELEDLTGLKIERGK